MRSCRIVMVFSLLLLGYAGTASAQQAEKKLGVTIGYPSAVGLLWPVTDRIAVRPALSFTWMSTDTLPTLSGLEPGSSSSTLVTLHADVLFYLSQEDDLRTYITPGLSYSRSTGSDDLVVHASYGAQYDLGTRFGVFGEVGLAFLSDSHSFDSFKISSKRFGMRSGVGVILYF